MLHDVREGSQQALVNARFSPFHLLPYFSRRLATWRSSKRGARCSNHDDDAAGERSPVPARKGGGPPPTRAKTMMMMMVMVMVMVMVTVINPGHGDGDGDGDGDEE